MISDYLSVVFRTFSARSICLAVLLFTAQAAYAQGSFSGTRPPRMAAVVVGVSKYKYTTRYDLQFADRDALQFSKLLGCTQKVEIDTIITLVNEKATTGNFESTLQYLGRLATDTSSRKIDYLLIYFSGHGKLGPADDDNEGYFIMHNSGGPDADTYGYAHTRLVKKLRKLFSGCSRIIMIADACHAGRFTGKKSINLPLLQEQNNFVAEEDRVIEILSSDGDKESFESPNLEHGLFTYYLIRGAEGEAYRNNDGVPSLEALDKYLRSNIESEKQIPVVKGDKSYFLSFDTCLHYARVSPEFIKEKSYESKHKSIPDQLPLEILFDSLLTAGNICLPLNASAYAVLKQVKSLKEYAGVYEDMRARYISAVLDEDVEIMYRYLNQDMNPWNTKFADMEKEIQMQKSMMEVLRPDNLLYRKTAARYFYFQAMAWYEYSKFVPKKDRIERLKKASKLISRSLKIKPDSPTAYFLQSQIYLCQHQGGKAPQREAQLAETRKRAPEWRLPYLYTRDKSSLQQYAELAAEYKEYASEPIQQTPLPASLTTETEKPLTPDQMAITFTGNPLLAEDLFLGYALEGKFSINTLRKHRRMAKDAYYYAMETTGTPNPVAPEKAPVVTELDKLAFTNSDTEKKAQEEILYEKLLDADTIVSEATRARWAALKLYENWVRNMDNTKSENATPKAETKDTSALNFISDPLMGKFIFVKGGTFNMGCTGDQRDCFNNEKPVHQVTLGDYYIAETEVTQAQWIALMGNNPSLSRDSDDRPVGNVSWEDAQKFISRLNARASTLRYRLPTEAEWEYAARGGANSRGYHYAGSNNINEVAWYFDILRKTRPVKGKKPNELGIYDMSGNMYEWCFDRYGDYTVERQTNPKGPAEGYLRVLRGGSWNSEPKLCRVSDRYRLPFDNQSNRIGFRLAASIPDISSNEMNNVSPLDEKEITGSEDMGNSTESKEQSDVRRNINVKEDAETADNELILPPTEIVIGEHSFTDQFIGKFVLVKGGKFNMGCTREQQGCFESEKPVHPVTLSDYYIAETEVTQAQWKAVMGYNSSFNKYCDNCPVDQVGWSDALEFINRLNARDGSPSYRLPTEAEWEYAARGGTNSRGYQYSGSNNINEVAWYYYNSRSTNPVKGKKPNELGIYDMSGNVFEWCSDWKEYYTADSQTNPRGPDKGIYRVYRGGSWSGGTKECRVSNRSLFEPRDREGYLGFRLATSAPK